MKELFFGCLLAATQSLFAQNIDLSEIETLLANHSPESIDNLLLNKGFQKAKIQGGAPVMGLQLKEGWYFRADPSSEVTSTTLIAKYLDTSGKTFYRVETSNPFFYSHLMNQLAENNYDYRGTVAKEKEANLVFSNNKYEVIIRIGSELKLKYHYQINIGETVSDISYFKPRKAVLKTPHKSAAVPKTGAKPRKRKTVPAKPVENEASQP